MTQETGAGEVIMINIGIGLPIMIMPIIAVGEGTPARRTVTPPTIMITGLTIIALARSNAPGGVGKAFAIGIAENGAVGAAAVYVMLGPR